jgi:hypothetical protein
MSELSRLTGVFFEPKRTFEDVAQRPAFWAPLLLLIVAGVVFTMLMSQRVGFERVIRQQTEMNPRAQQQMDNASPEQRERIARMQQTMAPVFGYAASVLARPLGYLIVAAILLGIVRGMMSAPLRFSQVFAIVAYAAMPDLIQTVLKTVVMYIKNPDDFNVMNPLAFNPAAFMDPMSGSRFLYTLALSLDLFTVWKLLLTAIGLHAAAPRKLSFGGALTAVVLPWAILTLAGAGIAGIFS